MADEEYWPELLVIELKRLVRAEKFNFDKVSSKLAAYSQSGGYDDIDLSSKSCRLAYARDYSNAPYDLNSTRAQSSSPENGQMTKAQRLKLTLERQEQERKAVLLQRQVLEQQQQEREKEKGKESNGDIAPFDFSQVDARVTPKTAKGEEGETGKQGVEGSIFSTEGASDIVRQALAAMTSEEKVDIDSLFPQRGQSTVVNTWKEDGEDTPYATDDISSRNGADKGEGTVMGNTTLETITSSLSAFSTTTASRVEVEEGGGDDDWESIMKKLESQEEANFQRKRAVFDKVKNVLIQDFGLDFDGLEHSIAAIDDARDATTATDGTNDGSGTTKDGRDGGGCREELVRLEASLATLTSRDLVDLPGYPLHNSSSSSALTNPMDIEVLRAFQESITTRLHKQKEYQKFLDQQAEAAALAAERAKLASRFDDCSDDSQGECFLLEGDDEMIRQMKARIERRREEGEAGGEGGDGGGDGQGTETGGGELSLPRIAPPAPPSPQSPRSPTSTLAASYGDMREVIASTVPQVQSNTSMQLDFSPEWEALLEGIEREQALRAGNSSNNSNNDSTSSNGDDGRDGDDDGERGELWEILNILDAAAAEKENRQRRPPAPSTSTDASTTSNGGTSGAARGSAKPREGKVLLKAGLGLPAIPQAASNSDGNRNSNGNVNNNSDGTTATSNNRSQGLKEGHPPAPPSHSNESALGEEKQHSPSSLSRSNPSTSRGGREVVDEESDGSDGDDDGNWKARRQRMKASLPPNAKGAMGHSSQGMYPGLSKAKSAKGHTPATTVTRGGGVDDSKGGTRVGTVSSNTASDDAYYAQLKEAKLQQQQSAELATTPTPSNSSNGTKSSDGSKSSNGSEETPVKGHKEQVQTQVTPMRISSASTTPTPGTGAGTEGGVTPPPSLLTINKRTSKGGKLLKIGKK